MLRLVSTVLVLAALVAGCGSSIEDEAEQLFRACIEAGGGSAGEFAPYVENGELLLVQGPVAASPELFESCLTETNQQLAGK